MTTRRITGMLVVLAVVTTAACTPVSEGADDTPSAGGDGGRDVATLARFDSCDAFGDEVRRRALDDLAANVRAWPAFASRVPDAVALEAAGSEVSADREFSDTNVQEEGVDEPDVVKTDGRFVYVLADGVLRIVDVRRPRPALAATLRPGDGVPRELLLHGTRLLLLGEAAHAPERGDVIEPSERGIVSLPPIATRTRLWAVDVGAPAEPRVTSTMAVDGTIVTARAVDGTARIVLRSTPHAVPLVAPGGAAPDRERAEAVNRQRIRDSDAAAWLPHAAVDAAPAAPLVACTAVHRPQEGGDTGIVSVVSLELDRPDLATDRVDAVLGAADTVYADRDSLYVTTSRWPQIPPLEPLPVEPGPVEPLPLDPPRPRPLPVEPPPPRRLPVEPPPPRRLPVEPPPPRPLPVEPPPPRPLPVEPPHSSERTGGGAPTVTTEVHHFDLTTAGAEYMASGSVEGTVLNQWALSEHDGDLRIATTAPAERGRRSASAVIVLRREGDRLVEVGRVGDLGRGERIYAVRYAGPVGFVVTFRQVDPLYTLDLSDPQAPRVLGELKIPGYSAYLHPVGDHHLLGVGQDADRRGRTRGLQVSLFDIGDLSAPTRVAQLTLGPHTHSPVEADHRALLAWPARDLLAMPVERWDVEEMGVLVLEATGAPTLEERGTIDLPAGLGYAPHAVRSVVVEDRLVTVTPGVVVVADLATLQQIGTLVL
jgi:uncharacterized secreted protein with C-terminal beta-propeller domain